MKSFTAFSRRMVTSAKVTTERVQAFQGALPLEECFSTLQFMTFCSGIPQLPIFLNNSGMSLVANQSFNQQ